MRCVNETRYADRDVRAAICVGPCLVEACLLKYRSAKTRDRTAMRTQLAERHSTRTLACGQQPLPSGLWATTERIWVTTESRTRPAAARAWIRTGRWSTSSNPYVRLSATFLRQIRNSVMAWRTQRLTCLASTAKPPDGSGRKGRADIALFPPVTRVRAAPRLFCGGQRLLTQGLVKAISVQFEADPECAEHRFVGSCCGEKMRKDAFKDA